MQLQEARIVYEEEVNKFLIDENERLFIIYIKFSVILAILTENLFNTLLKTH
jgi:hypothetical protein